jgi:hypothetical protein
MGPSTSTMMTCVDAVDGERAEVTLLDQRRARPAYNIVGVGEAPSQPAIRTGSDRGHQRTDSKFFATSLYNLADQALRLDWGDHVTTVRR